MKNKVFSDYSLLDARSERGRSMIVGALTAFMQQPQVVINKMLEMGITNYSTTSDVGADIKVLIETMHLGLAEIDSGWASFFDVRDFTNTNAPGFQVRTTSSGLTFSKRPEGGRARIYRLNGDVKNVSFDTYGGGLEFDQAWFEDQQWWLVEDTSMEFRSKWYKDKATVMYDLIGAIGSGQNTAYDTTGATQLDKDIITINTAAAALLVAAQAAGLPVTASTPLVCLSPIQLKARLQRALAAQYITPATSGASMKVEYNITPTYSLNVRNAGAACTDKWYIGIPGLKSKMGERMNLSVGAQYNLQAFATTTVGWGRYGAYLNEAQVRRLATA